MNDDLVTLISELKQNEAIQITEQRLKSGEDPLKILDDGKKAMQIFRNDPANERLHQRAHRHCR